VNEATDSIQQSQHESAVLTRGLWLAIAAAVGYSATNLLLRKLSDSNSGMGWDIWVSAGKSFPTAVTAWILVGRQALRGNCQLPSGKLFWPLLAAALVMQFGGNVGFQVALGHIGLAVSVPLVFACIICSGALLGRTILGDPITGRTLASVGLMMVAIVVLSAVASGQAAAVPESAEAEAGTAADSVIGVIAALVSGLAYGANGVVIRRYVRDKLPVESTLIVYGTTGLVCLSSLSFALLGAEGIRQIATEDWWTVLLAGCCNAAAFFAITHSLRVMSITRVNVINASQNAMCAVGAVMLFSEHFSMAMGFGIALTMLGLVVLDRR
jgi:drug/metabolite transporter (DMT)-like permease